MSATLTITPVPSHPIPPRLIIPPPPTSPDGLRRTTSSISVGTLSHSTTTVHSSPPETPSTFGGQQPHNPPVQTSDHLNKKVSKSKNTSILGFLTVKEPSRLALEQYERDMKRKAAEAAKRTGRPLNPNALAAPTAKLPASVPKVNSKWDGLPKAVSEQKKGKRGQENLRERRAEISGRREHWHQLRNETHTSFATFGARHSGVGSQRRSRSQASRDGSEYPWVQRYSHSGRSRSSTLNSPPQTSSSLGSWSVSSQSEAPSIMSDFTWDGFQIGPSGLSVREAALKAPPVTPNSQPLSSFSLGALSSNSSRSEVAMRSVGKGLATPPVSAGSTSTAPLVCSGVLAKRDVETERGQSMGERMPQPPSGFDQDILGRYVPLMTTALAASREMNKSDPLVSANTESTLQEEPQNPPNHSKERHVVGRNSIVTPWESLEPPKSAPDDARPPSPPCPVKGLLRRAKRRIFSKKEAGTLQ